MTQGSAIASLLRAQIYAVQGRVREVASAYAEALTRNPRQPEVRLQLARASLSLGDRDECLRQTKFLLDSDPDQPNVVLLHCQALAAEGGSATQVAERRAQALELLGKTVAKAPKFAEAYHLMADIHNKMGDRAKTVADLKAGLAANDADAGGLSLLIRVLTEPQASGPPASAANVADAKAAADAMVAKDRDGSILLAAAVGFHKTGHLDIALPYAEAACKKMDGNPVAHLNLGDLLLSLAESSRDQAKAKAYFEQSVAQYDSVLKALPTSVEAINNKAWILHSYLNRSQEALDLAKGLTTKVDPARLPAEFFDTLGTIQLALGQMTEAEDSFNKGLKKSPEMPVLNYHMGKLLSSDRERRQRALLYLEKARAGQNQLSPDMVADVTALLEKTVR
jgi:tetratricopeptide (TPR) repeat protein